MTLTELRYRVVIRVLVGTEHPEWNHVVGAKLELPGTGDTDAVSVESQLDHHHRMKRSLAALRVVIGSDDLGQIKRIDYLANEIGQMVLRQPFPQ